MNLKKIWFREKTGPIKFFKAIHVKHIVITGVLITVSVLLYFMFKSGKTILNQKKSLKELNIILITLDTLRLDHVSIYNGEKARTPNIDRMAEAGIWFENCIAQVPMTLPSHTSILSGTYPSFHGIKFNSGFLVPDSLEMLAEILEERGFATSAFVAAYVLHSSTGINQGFSHFSDKFDLGMKIFSIDQLQKRAEEVLSDSKKWLLANKEKKFFTWIHLFDPHTPYDPPLPFKRKYPDNYYRGEVEYMDEHLGIFFAFLKKEGIEDKCLIIITSDHGEGLGDHGEKEHGYFIYNSTVRIPLIIKAPFTFPVQNIKDIVEHVDIAPTILDALDIPVPGSFHGESLLNPMFGKKRSKKIAYTESSYANNIFDCAELKAFYHENWKYILTPREELYNIQEDENEIKNLALSKSNKKKKMNRRLLDFIKQSYTNAKTPEKIKRPGTDALKKLQALGYITTGTKVSRNSILPDLKDKIQSINEFEQAKELYDKGFYDEALSRALHFNTNNSGIIPGLELVANCYYKKNMFEQALPYFRAVLNRDPGFVFAMYSIISCFTNLGKIEEGIKEGEIFIRIYPKDYLLLNKLANLHFIKKDFNLATEIIKKSLQIEENNLDALKLIANIKIIRRETESARGYVNRILQIDSRSKYAYFYQAQIESAEGNIKKAIQYYKKELEIYPDNHRAAYNLAEELRTSGDFPAAVFYYRQAIKIKPDFNVPYFIIAKYMIDKKLNITEAINLCKKGISIKPLNKYTLFGYSILVNVYQRRGDKKNANFYYSQGQILYEKLKKEEKL